MLKVKIQMYPDKDKPSSKKSTQGPKNQVV